eukprot:CAMPEP_0116132880 /NCGR_PEP_ID=MMETSP0329-20121206/9796_1 /TAXON_ID=697910 /ORGANISM="Pseudo-nitzschia arenysensis, Strain B593" /LENGTH=417 /DNA_ID=CAMNT_0003627449 /DNA_START=149 /DNA_END=1402 /DNA_ORIENTATION=+
MFSFFGKPKDETPQAEMNLHEEGRSDDDSFATRSSRTIGFIDEPAPKPEEDYSSRHSRSFLDAVNFDDDDEGDGGFTTEDFEDLTDSQREARFKAAEVAELTDSQRENRANFLNESLVAQGTPNLGADNTSSHHSREEETGLLAGGSTYPQHENLMIEEGISMNLLDATDRYQDNFVLDATKLALKRNRCARYSRIGVIFLMFVVTMAVGSIFIVDQVEKREARLSGNSLKPGHMAHVETIETPSIDPGEFYELEISFPKDDDNTNKNAACMDNPNFLHDGKHGQDCEWVSTSETVARCARQGVKENCQATCDPSCSSPTGFPTEYPTFEPTASIDDDDDVDDDNVDDDEDEDEDEDVNFKEAIAAIEVPAEAPTEEEGETPYPTFLTYAPTVPEETKFPTEYPTVVQDTENEMGFR